MNKILRTSVEVRSEIVGIYHTQAYTKIRKVLGIGNTSGSFLQHYELAPSSSPTLMEGNDINTAEALTMNGRTVIRIKK